MRKVLAVLVAISLVGTDSASADLGLNIALEAAAGSCVALAGDVYERVDTILTARGHTVSVVSGTDIDTAAEIDAFDVVVFGAGNFACDWDWPTFDGELEAYVQGGGGLVTTGWVAYYMASNTKSETYPGLETVLPVVKGTDSDFGGTINVVGGHPITSGVADFPNPAHDNYGGGVPVGDTVLIQHGGVDAGAARELGLGRVVYLGPIYLANWSTYTNEPLLDGTTPDAQQLFVNAVEWAGQSLGPPPTPTPVPTPTATPIPIPFFSAWGLVTMTVLLGASGLYMRRRAARQVNG